MSKPESVTILVTLQVLAVTTKIYLIAVAET